MGFYGVVLSFAFPLKLVSSKTPVSTPPSEIIYDIKISDKPLDYSQCRPTTTVEGDFQSEKVKRGISTAIASTAIIVEPTTTVQTPTPTTATPSPLASQWGQCGGLEWSGPTVCVDGISCVYENPCKFSMPFA